MYRSLLAVSLLFAATTAQAISMEAPQDAKTYALQVVDGQGDLFLAPDHLLTRSSCVVAAMKVYEMIKEGDFFCIDTEGTGTLNTSDIADIFYNKKR